MQAVILAGGKGSRLKPFTTAIPKPLMPIDDLPILEIVLRQLKYYGFSDVILAVNHLAQLIMTFFGNGEKLGLNIKYSMEDKMLGTAGPLSLINNLEEHFLVLNGDLLTTLNFDELFKYHVNVKSDATLSAYKQDIKIDLGVLEIEKEELVDYVEKPVYSYMVSTGIYVLNREVVEYVPKNEKMDLPDLIMALKRENKTVKCYQGDYYWLDIGRINDYEESVEIFKARRSEFLPFDK